MLMYVKLPANLLRVWKSLKPLATCNFRKIGRGSVWKSLKSVGTCNFGRFGTWVLAVQISSLCDEVFEFGCTRICVHGTLLCCEYYIAFVKWKYIGNSWSFYFWSKLLHIVIAIFDGWKALNSRYIADYCTQYNILCVKLFFYYSGIYKLNNYTGICRPILHGNPQKGLVHWSGACTLYTLHIVVLHIFTPVGNAYNYYVQVGGRVCCL